ncbi:hypothetical protein QAD02_019953 [Eretmocerus hayati]|uniref:Uncharacterized protein n=1 Tax=Eretmocerus hayati TaxID=131215 RepID=A0ACC2PMX9_9HYME|nr:hypothetical protein QAD02_019953 [Eretmocerus hayati]
MWALVFWTASKQKSVIPEENLCPDCNEGEVTLAKLTASGKKFKVKLLRKSQDSKYLESLPVSTDGSILKRTYKGAQSRVLNQKSDLQRASKLQSLKKSAANQKNNELLIDTRSIYDDVGETSSISGERDSRMNKRGAAQDSRGTQKKGSG